MLGAAGPVIRYWRVALVVLAVGGLLLLSAAVPADASVTPQSYGFAARLAALDPGARRDATTIVGTGTGQTILGAAATQFHRCSTLIGAQAATCWSTQNGRDRGAAR